MDKDFVYGLGLITLAILLIILGPILTIWSLNTLFPVLAIPYTWQTWLASLILGGLLTSKYRGK